jgi:hypothetical protein
MTLAGFAWLAWTAASGQRLAVLEPAVVLIGLGMGFVTPNMNVAIQNAAPPAHLGAVTASSGFFRSLGGVIGVAGSGAILSNHLHAALTSGAFGGLKPERRAASRRSPPCRLRRTRRWPRSTAMASR